MKKIIFGGKDLLGRDTKDNYPTDSKYMLLSYFIDDTRYSINEDISRLESVYKGEKTFEEILDHPQVAWDFGEGSGYIECDQKTASLISFYPNSLPSMELPLKELIDILYEWKTFLGK